MTTAEGSHAVGSRRKGHCNIACHIAHGVYPLRGLVGQPVLRRGRPYGSGPREVRPGEAPDHWLRAAPVTATAAVEPAEIAPIGSTDRPAGTTTPLPPVIQRGGTQQQRQPPLVTHQLNIPHLTQEVAV